MQHCEGEGNNPQQFVTNLQYFWGTLYYGDIWDPEIDGKVRTLVRSCLHKRFTEFKYKWTMVWNVIHVIDKLETIFLCVSTCFDVLDLAYLSRRGGGGEPGKLLGKVYVESFS